MSETQKNKTLVLGASPNPNRYSHMATETLHRHQIPVVPVGIRKGAIDHQDIILGKPDVTGIDTITLYVGPSRQPEYYDYLIGLNPRRIIFNPGTENPELIHLAEKAGIETEIACTLVLLNTGQY